MSYLDATWGLAIAVTWSLGCGPRTTASEPSNPLDDLGGDASPSTDLADGAATRLPAVPLHTMGRWIVDANGRRYKLASVNWYGAEEQDHVPAGLELRNVGTIAHEIASLGFNSVRVPWSNELYETNPVVADSAVAANPALQGKPALEVLDAVIAALAHEGLVVILDNHMSNGDWCCSDTDRNTLWYNEAYPEASWLADWKGMVTRYLGQPAVVGVDLRNELRGAVTWGGDASTDWHAAAQRGGEAVLSVNPNLLVIVEGLANSSDLKAVYSLPVQLSQPNRLVYSPHDYSWFHNGLGSSADLHTELGNAWGFILTQNQPYTAPIWVGELGTCNTSVSCVSGSTPGSQGLWFSALLSYLTVADIDWSYWAANGTQARGTSRSFGAAETYGVLDPTWTAPSLAALDDSLHTIIVKTQGP